NENRVAMTPSGVIQLKNAEHNVYIETAAGEGSGFRDEDYTKAGATIVMTAKEAWEQDMVLKVKEPLPEEYDYLREGLILFAYLHLANEPELTKELVDKKVAAFAYETVQLPDNSLPLLTPMSEIAGSMATQIGAHYLEKPEAGKAIVLDGVPGVKRRKVTVIGGGAVGTNAAKIAAELVAEVSILYLNPTRLRQLHEMFGNEANVLMSNEDNIRQEVVQSDIAIGSVLIPGAKAPVLVSEEMIQAMEDGSVVVDVAIDQGGNFATSTHATTHANPVYTKHGVIHYTVSNIPGAVPRTATLGLTNVTVPYAAQIANKGYQKALLENEALLKGLNVLNGKVTNQPVAELFDLPYAKTEDLLK